MHFNLNYKSLNYGTDSEIYERLRGQQHRIRSSCLGFTAWREGIGGDRQISVREICCVMLGSLSDTWSGARDIRSIKLMKNQEN
jgi:hypothetical protein